MSGDADEADGGGGGMPCEMLCEICVGIGIGETAAGAGVGTGAGAVAGLEIVVEAGGDTEKGVVPNCCKNVVPVTFKGFELMLVLVLVLVLMLALAAKGGVRGR